jgi:hypothetical protein
VEASKVRTRWRTERRGLATTPRCSGAWRHDKAIGLKVHRDRTLIVRKRAEHHIERGQSAGITAVMARIYLRRMMART